MSIDDLTERLATIADDLADLALERLSQAASAAAAGEAPDPDLLAQERRITRARHAVERALALLQARTGEH